MGKSQLLKGNCGERAIVTLLRQSGFGDATRNYADKVDRQGVDVFAGNLAIQVKTYRKPAPLSKYKEIKVDGYIKALVTKGDYGKWMIAMTLDDFLLIAQDVGVLYHK